MRYTERERTLDGTILRDATELLDLGLDIKAMN
jgi:hypothetical protein